MESSSVLLLVFMTNKQVSEMAKRIGFCHMKLHRPFLCNSLCKEYKNTSFNS